MEVLYVVAALYKFVSWQQDEELSRALNGNKADNTSVGGSSGESENVYT